MALSYQSLVGMYPYPDQRPKLMTFPISPMDMEVAPVLARQDHLEHVTFLVTEGDCPGRSSSPSNSLGYHLISELLGQWYRLCLLKTAMIVGKNNPSGVLPALAPIVMALSQQYLEELIFEQTELPVEHPYPAKLFKQTKCGKLVFNQTVMCLSEKLFGDMVGVELDAGVESLEFLLLKDEYFVSWVLGLVPTGRSISVRYRGREPFNSQTWTLFKPHLHCIKSWCIEHPCFMDGAPNSLIWHDLSTSPVRDLHLVQPEFIRSAYEAFLKYIETGPLESFRLSGYVKVTDDSVFDTTNKRLHPTKDLLTSIAKSNVKWLSFPYTDCGVGMAIAEAIPTLKVEVLDIGLWPPNSNENGPGAALVEKLDQNKTIGAISDPVRRKVANDLGIVGLTVRSLMHEGNNTTSEGKKNWTALSFTELDLVDQICRRNMDEYNMDEYYREFKMNT